MVTSTIVTNEKDLKTCSDSIRKIIKKSGHCSVAFSSQGMKCEEFVLRGLPQNALFHIWIRDAAKAAFEQEPTEVELEGMKRYVKQKCYTQTKQNFLVQSLANPKTKETRLDLTSSSKWLKGEMTFVLDWMQAFFAEQGVILEARGEYVELTEAQNK
tara:strand:- start:1071 stop:1541 length:471 start_codon:yes stop_codon:yes gene_type:complete